MTSLRKVSKSEAEIDLFLILVWLLFISWTIEASYVSIVPRSLDRALSVIFNTADFVAALQKEMEVILNYINLEPEKKKATVSRARLVKLPN